MDDENQSQENKNYGFSETCEKKMLLNFHFLIDSQMIDVVQEYTYLGTRMSSSGNFSVSREHLKEKALHAFFSLRWHMNLSKLKAALACKIFDT